MQEMLLQDEERERRLKEQNVAGCNGYQVKMLEFWKCRLIMQSGIQRVENTTHEHPTPERIFEDEFGSFSTCMDDHGLETGRGL